MVAPMPSPIRSESEPLTGRKIGRGGHFRYGKSVGDGFEATNKQKLPIQGLKIRPFYEFWPRCDTFRLLKSRSRVFLSISNKNS